jgi:hypothetical protein
MTESQLERENTLVLDALQASLGLISQDIRGISVLLEAEKIVLHFALREENACVEADIEEMAFELDALRDGATRIETLLYVGAPDKKWPGRIGRLIYLAKEPGSGQ